MKDLKAKLFRELIEGNLIHLQVNIILGLFEQGRDVDAYGVWDWYRLDEWERAEGRGWPN